MNEVIADKLTSLHTVQSDDGLRPVDVGNSIEFIKRQFCNAYLLCRAVGGHAIFSCSNGRTLPCFATLNSPAFGGFPVTTWPTEGMDKYPLVAI
jgi:hypothetical protein